MLSVKEAAAIAVKYFLDVYGDQYSNIKLEEAELSEEDNCWYITLGFDVPFPPLIAEVLQVPAKREYKLLRINSSGDVLAMKIRTVP